MLSGICITIMIAPILLNSQENSGKEYKSSNHTKRGHSNTPLKPETALSLLNAIGDSQSNTNIGVSYFCDWLTIFGEGMRMSSRHEDLLVRLFLYGDYWKTAECYHLEMDAVSVQRIDCFSETRPASGKKWEYRYENTHGVKLYIAHQQIDGVVNENIIDSLKVEFSGSVLAYLIPRNNQLKLVEMMDIIEGLNDKLHCTRCDLTVEFGHDLIDYKEMFFAQLNGNYCGAKKSEYIGGKEVDKELEYPTLYFGGKKSDKKVRIYETMEKHGYAGIRIEVQNKGKYAKKVSKDLRDIYNSGFYFNGMDAKSKEDLAMEITNYIRDFVLSKKTISFVDRSNKRSWMSLRDYQDLPFWKEFKDNLRVQELNYFFPPKTVDIHKSMKWLLRQGSGLVRVLIDSLGFDLAVKELVFFAKINEAKYGKGYSENSQKLLNQIKDMGKDAIFEMFDHDTKMQLRNVGFYKTPSYPKYMNRNSVFDYEFARKHPRNYTQLELEF